MSAFICTDLHFSVIARETCPDSINLQEWANYLKRINIESVNYRYNDNTRKTACKLTETATVYSIDDMAGIIRCYLYQSCEKPSIEFYMLDAYLNSRIRGVNPDRSNVRSI